MNVPFAIGAEYPRQELLNFLGSKQPQSGVIWGDRELGAIVCTTGGRHGKKAGYEDLRQADGTWVYFGQGTSGNQNLESKANQLISSGEKTIPLFDSREATAAEVRARNSWGKFYKYLGVFQTGAYDYFTPADGKRRGDQLIRFVLVPQGLLRQITLSFR